MSWFPAWMTVTRVGESREHLLRATPVQNATSFEQSILAPASHSSRLLAHLRRHALPYFLILPSVLVLIAIEFYPLGVGLVEAFKYHNRVQPWATHYNGIENFVKAFNDHTVRVSLKTSFIMAFGIVSLSYALGLLASEP